MRYAGIDRCDICNGNNVGVSVYVQGCYFHCEGCFNKETWDFNGGYEWNSKIESELIQLLSKPYTKRLSILGGEPLAAPNLPLTLEILHIATDIILQKNKELKIWLYTGFTFEDIIFSRSSDYSPDRDRATAVFLSDYIVDGKFEIDKQDLTYSKVKFAGSTNQRIIDVQKSIREEKTILWNGEKE